MNMISSRDTFAGAGLEKENSQLKKLVSSWEKKNAASAAKAGGISLMALSLAACGSSSDEEATVDTGATTPVAPTPTNQTLVYTVDTVDTLVGGAGDDTAIGDSGAMTGADSFSGGAGADTLKLYADAAGAEIINTTGVETISVQATAVADVNLSGATGYTTLVDDGSTASFDFDAVGTMPAQVTISGTSVGGGDTDIQLTANAIVGTDDTFNLALDDMVATRSVSTSTATTAGSIENLAITANAGTVSTATVTLNNALLSAPSTTIAATGDLSLAGALTGATIDASASTGKVSLVVGAATSTVTGGSGNDTIDMGGNLTSADTIVGGEGTDTLSIDTGDTTLGTEPNAINVSGVETLDLDVASADDTIDFDVFANSSEITAVTVTTSADAADITLTDTQATTFTFANTDGTAGDAADALVIDYKTQSGASDVANITLKNNDDANAAGFVIGSLSVPGVETLNITTARGTGDVDLIDITAQLDGAYKTVNISGNTDLDLSSAVENSMTTMDASSFTGNLTVTLGTGGDTVTSGSGADTITGGSGADTISTGAGNDYIKGEDGADDITTGSGDDRIEIDDVDAVDRIRDFETGNDADEIEIDISAITADTGSLVLSDSADGDQGASDDLVFHSIANGTTSAAAAIADTVNTIVITNTTGINSEADVSFSLTLDSTADAADALLAMFYDADDGQAIVGFYTLTASTAVSAANTFTQVLAMDMTATEYSAITVDNFDLV